jgi:hypothetical protein
MAKALKRPSPRFLAEGQERGVLEMTSARKLPLVLASLVWLAPMHQPLIAQSATSTQHPTFAGTWTPSDPARSDQLFSVGLTSIPGDGGLKIDQTPDLLTVTTIVPESKLKVRMNLLNGPFTPTMVYLINRPAGRAGGSGAGGPAPLAVPTWVADRLVIPHARPDTDRTKGLTLTYSFDGDKLKQDTHWDLVDGRSNTVTELFTRAK